MRKGSPKSVVTLGTFDGLHRGHQAILRRVVAQARRRKWTSTALTFQMPPRHAGVPRREPVLLTTPGEKFRRLRTLSIQRIRPLLFTRRLQSTPAHVFFEKKIRRQCRAGAMIVGPKVAFGKNRAGRLSLLKTLGQTSGVRIEVVRPVYDHRQAISSRRIRSLLNRGRVEEAERMLGYPYAAEGRVVHGDGRGKILGFPTANCQVDPDKILPPGVFWVKVRPASRAPVWSRRDLRGAWDGLCNVGTRPTFHPGQHRRSCEVFLFGPPRSLYGRTLCIVFLKRLRPERSFSSARALQRQIARDVVRTKRFKL